MSSPFLVSLIHGILSAVTTYAMKQIYLIGILVALLILVLFGLNKMNNSGANIAPARDTASESTITEGDDTTNTNDTSMSDTTVPTENTTVVMKTNKGDITIELFLAESPITAGNFYTLAANDFYDGVKFHRVIDGFMIQGGDPNSMNDDAPETWGFGGSPERIQDEFIEGLSNVRGTLSMANSGPNTGRSQFFINTADNTRLDWDKEPAMSKHPVFGRVVEGMDVVDAISKVATGEADRPVEAVVIEDIVVN